MNEASIIRSCFAKKGPIGNADILASKLFLSEVLTADDVDLIKAEKTRSLKCAVSASRRGSLTEPDRNDCRS
jgi:hypothetical protein